GALHPATASISEEIASLEKKIKLIEKMAAKKEFEMVYKEARAVKSAINSLIPSLKPNIVLKVDTALFKDKDGRQMKKMPQHEWVMFPVCIENRGTAKGSITELKLVGNSITSGSVLEANLLKDIMPGEQRLVHIQMKFNYYGTIPVKATCIFKGKYSTGHTDTSLSLPVASKEEMLKTAKVEDKGKTFITVSGRLENRQGYIVLKMDVKNISQVVVSEGVLKLIYDNKVFQISHVEPEYEVKESEIILGGLLPGGFYEFSVYFDPLNAVASTLEAVFQFRTPEGEILISQMERLNVKVELPEIKSTEDINIPQLKQLIEKECSHSDSKVLVLPPALSADKAIQVAKEVISSLSLRLVREVSKKIKSRDAVEVWYYGVSQQGKVVSKAVASKDTDSLVFMVFSTNPDFIPWYLARFYSQFNEFAVKKGYIAGSVTYITNVSIKDSIIQRSNLLFGSGGEGSGDVNIVDSVVQRSSLDRKEDKKIE
ncbi:MAG: hypothetical protein QW728_03000, partial [Thermoplasmata archaeon]